MQPGCRRLFTRREFEIVRRENSRCGREFPLTPVTTGFAVGSTKQRIRRIFELPTKHTFDTNNKTKYIAFD